ncbi:uncharacterized protein ASCRUDRAFT_79013 [Ascoidea rubescens DSM 1968]|uniref:Uncharacterized protein n=1 Tax=Ascoidea rubescens DSM 1968 TaxID=1344418 RepID=A0A1D2VR47_9ASCO|nr:hypothetical protein ASCRUDRAFT_79013 [Ascoidea rubescens DSM 1968]ODV64084.1 hypothetical protein ASCRUDRAFT_79013 [Ascoidea rubescens DSM 1968]
MSGRHVRNIGRISQIDTPNNQINRVNNEINGTNNRTNNRSINDGNERRNSQRSVEPLPLYSPPIPPPAYIPQ